MYKYHDKANAGRDAHEAQTRAKFEYFRCAEAAICAGPAPVKYHPPVHTRNTTPVCGTHSGWARHNRDKTAQCRPCLDARAIYQREYRHAKKARG